MKFFCYEIFRFRSHYKSKQAFLPNVPVARSGVVNSKSTKSTFLSNVYLAEMNYPLTLMLTFIYIFYLYLFRKTEETICLSPLNLHTPQQTKLPVSHIPSSHPVCFRRIDLNSIQVRGLTQRSSFTRLDRLNCNLVHLK